MSANADIQRAMPRAEINALQARLPPARHSPATARSAFGGLVGTLDALMIAGEKCANPHARIFCHGSGATWVGSLP
jgi:hypothetical protein